MKINRTAGRPGWKPVPVYGDFPCEPCQKKAQCNWNGRCQMNQIIVGYQWLGFTLTLSEEYIIRSIERVSGNLITPNNSY